MGNIHSRSRLLEPEEIRRRVEGLLRQDRPGRGRRILVTGGGTREPIDAVRYIGNHSTGRTAAVLADALAERGFEVSWLGGTGAMAPGPGVLQHRYETFRDLADALEALLGEKRFDAVIHAAAVSDFSVDRAGIGGADGKLASGTALSLPLIPNPKLLTRLRDWSRNPDLLVVGFKLTVGADTGAVDAAVDRLFANGACDLVVHNDFERITAGRHAYELRDASGGRRGAPDTRVLAGLITEALTPGTAGDGNRQAECLATPGRREESA